MEEEGRGGRSHTKEALDFLWKATTVETFDKLLKDPGRYLQIPDPHRQRTTKTVRL